MPMQSSGGGRGPRVSNSGRHSSPYNKRPEYYRSSPAVPAGAPPPLPAASRNNSSQYLPSRPYQSAAVASVKRSSIKPSTTRPSGSPLPGNYERHSSLMVTMGQKEASSSWSNNDSRRFYKPTAAASRYSPRLSPQRRSRGCSNEPPRHLAADLSRTDRARTALAAARLPNNKEELKSIENESAQIRCKKRPPPEAPTIQETATIAAPIQKEDSTALEPPLTDLAVQQQPTTQSANGVVDVTFGLIPQDNRSYYACRPMDIAFELVDILEFRTKAAKLWASHDNRKRRGGWQPAIPLGPQDDLKKTRTSLKAKPSEVRSALGASFHFILAKARPESPRQKNIVSKDDEQPPAQTVTLPLARIHLFRQHQQIYPQHFIWPPPIGVKVNIKDTFWATTERIDDTSLEPPVKRIKQELNGKKNPNTKPSNIRSWPQGCRFLIVWGFEMSGGNRSNSSYVEGIIE